MYKIINYLFYNYTIKRYYLLPLLYTMYLIIYYYNNSVKKELKSIILFINVY